MDALADPSLLTTSRTPHGVVDMTGSDAPFDPAFLDIPVVNRALAESKF